MKKYVGYCITIKGDKDSENGFKRLKESVPENVSIRKFNAITPDNSNVYHLLESRGIVWKYPFNEDKWFDKKSGLMLKGYQTKDYRKRIACFLSHLMIWEKCLNTKDGFFIFEHDAVFNKDIKNIPDTFLDKMVVGINDPFGATRRPSVYHEHVISHSDKEFVEVPVVSDDGVPQGLAGNSAYWMSKLGAKRAIELVSEHGGWPNDALLCKTFIPELLQTTKYYIKTLPFGSSTSE